MRCFLGVYLILLGTEELHTGPGLVYVSAGCLFVVFMTGLVVHTVRIRFSFTGAMMVLFAVTALLSMFWSDNEEVTTHYALMLAQLMATTWITASCLEDNASLELITWWLLLIPVVPSFFMLRDFLTGSNAAAAYTRPGRDMGDRMSFANADPNLAAFRFAVGILAALHLGMTYRNLLLRLALFSVAGLITLSSLLTGSRGGALALAGGVTVLLLYQSRVRKATVIMAMAGFLVLFVSTLPYLPASVSSRYLGIGNEISSGTMAERKSIYREGLQSFNQRPTLGVGFLAFAYSSRQHGGLGKAAHNDLLEVVLDLGLVGLTIFLIMMYGIVRMAFQAPASSRGFMIALLVTYGISSMSITLIGTKLPWALFGIVLGVGAFHRAPAASRSLSWAEPQLGSGPQDA